jgi:EAL domain-containing protein (putative c-di-GMP-specific phosphodiesterase class I)
VDLTVYGGNQGLNGTIVTLAHNLGKQVIAEEVGTPGQVALLRPLHCEYAQWYFSPNQ